jgi:hypothetical protein
LTPVTNGIEICDVDDDSTGAAVAVTVAAHGPPPTPTGRPLRTIAFDFFDFFDFFSLSLGVSLLQPLGALASGTSFFRFNIAFTARPARGGDSSA